MGLPKPKFEEFGASIKVTIYRAIGVIGVNSDDTNDTNDIKIEPEDFLVEVNEKIVAMLRKNEKVTQKEISDELGISLSTVKRNMTALQGKGIIVRVGSNKAGYWKVNKES